VIDGYGAAPIENGVVLISGDRISAVGRAGEVSVPPGTPVIDTNGMTVLPGLFDMHVHLQILGHGDYRRWNELHGANGYADVMPIAARQLLMAGVTSARDLGGPLETLIDAGVDVIKLIDQDQMTDAEVEAVVQTAHKAGKPVVAHAHRMAEIRRGLDHGIDDFQHTGLGTAPGYPDDILVRLRERNTSLYWTPTISPLYVLRYTGEVFPERLDDPAWRQFMPTPMADEIRASLAHIPWLPYYALFPSRIPLLPRDTRARATGGPHRRSWRSARGHARDARCRGGDQRRRPRQVKPGRT
jgi:hypothetical protein